MHILHVTRDLPPHTRGGVSIAVLELLRALGEAGVQGSVVSFDGFRPKSGSGRRPVVLRQSTEGCQVLRLSTQDGLLPAAEFGARQQPDLVHVHDPMLWEFGQQVAAQRDVPAVLQVHVLHAALDRLRGVQTPTLSRRAERVALGQAQRVLAPSATVRDELLALDPRLAGQVDLCPLGVSRQPVARDPQHEVLYMGRFADVKGTLDWACALPHVLRGAPRLRARIVGGVPDRASAHRRWQRRIEEAVPEELRTRLSFEPWLPPAQRDAAYARASLLVVPSWYETFGLSAAEGMVHGLPIVATRGGALAERLQHEQTALLCEPQQHRQLAETVLRMVKAPELAAELGRNAARQALRTLDWKQLVPAYRKSYDRALTA